MPDPWRLVPHIPPLALRPFEDLSALRRQRTLAGPTRKRPARAEKRTTAKVDLVDAALSAAIARALAKKGVGT